jgi:magnesium transporter
MVVSVEADMSCFPLAVWISIHPDSSGDRHPPPAWNLLEAIVDRAAELLQIVDDELEGLSTEIFGQDGTASGPTARKDPQPIMQKVGRDGDLAKRLRGSLHTLAPMVLYRQADRPKDATDDIAVRLATVDHDIASLLDHDRYLMSNVTFLLDATLGLINIQQTPSSKFSRWPPSSSCRPRSSPASTP